MTSNNSDGFVVEPQGSSGGVCECCGETSQNVWGLVNKGDRTVAAFFAQWTVGRLADHPGNLDLVIGPWGEDTSDKDRSQVSLLYKSGDDGGSFMVIDPEANRLGKELASMALSRSDVIGTPLAQQVFDLVDAICLQDERVFAD